MLSHELGLSFVDSMVVFAKEILLPGMVTFFVLAVCLRVLIYYTVKREEWFAKEFTKRVRKFMDARDDKAEQSFYVISKRLLEITFYEVFEIRSIMKRRNPDAIMTLTDRVFLVQQGSARIVSDMLRQIKYLKWGDRPKFLEISNNTLRNNPCFNRVFGVIPVSTFNDFLNTLPGLFIVGGIFGTFLGIMKALPELGGMNVSDVEGSKLIMDTFLMKIAFSMSSSSIGILLSVCMGLVNTFFSCEKIYMDTVERFENDFDVLWSMSSSNKLPADISTFDADRDPIEVLSEDLIAKELNVEIGFVNLIKPISHWWQKMEKKPVTQVPVTVSKNNSVKEDQAA